MGNPFINYENWKEKYSRLLDSAGDMLLEEFFKQMPVMPSAICLLCAEKKTTDCHRSLIGDYLEKKGVGIGHIE